jgi:pyruvate dehydrogenase E2 component (dihydrolipoamide acetyltransferase)
VVKDVPQLSLAQVAGQTRELTGLARRGQLPAERLQGGVFTITNLGAHGVDAFTPLLNLPQSAILGVGRIGWEAAVVDGKIVPQQQATLSLTFDHRVLDGTTAAEFLANLREAIEQPRLLLHD